MTVTEGEDSTPSAGRALFSLIDLDGNNAKQSYDQRFRILKPNARKIQEELQEAIGLDHSAISMLPW